MSGGGDSTRSLSCGVTDDVDRISFGSPAVRWLLVADIAIRVLPQRLAHKLRHSICDVGDDKMGTCF